LLEKILRLITERFDYEEYDNVTNIEVQKMLLFGHNYNQKFTFLSKHGKIFHVIYIIQDEVVVESIGRRLSD
jgi:hypothetical protein